MRALQQQVNALQNHDAALVETQLRSQLTIGQGLQDLPTTVLNRAQAPTRIMLVDQNGLGKPPVFSGKERRLLRAKKVVNYA